MIRSEIIDEQKSQKKQAQEPSQDEWVHAAKLKRISGYKPAISILQILPIILSPVN